jgi:serine/threonine protein kinase
MQPSQRPPSVAVSAAPAAREWTGTSRYSVLRRLGEGGMGVVYEALDREGRRHLALKTLLRIDPDSLYLFKQEFRTLADVHHRNLVHLYELVQPEDGPLFFTMELVQGTDFIEYVHHAPRVRGSESSSSTAHSQTALVTRHGSARPGVASIAPPLSLGDEPTRADADRLRRSLRQLVLGLGALHGAGKLHRDVKPSNVLVTSEGRVVILDFGIALELSRATDEAAREGGVVGTPRYVSPEQAVGDVPTPASDWYAVGVMLYEALAGRPPFEGSSADVLSRKAMEEALPPSTWARGIPPDLEALCVDLLRREPGERPLEADILRRLLAGTSASLVPPARSAREVDRGPPLFVGREAQLRALRDALDLVVAGQAVTVRLGGGAGMGKSALARHFLDTIEASGAIEVLSGRAYERESVPYKAVDSLVDSLATLLLRVEASEGSISAPKHAAALLRLFPVLKRVASFATLPEPVFDDAQTVRQNAFGALRELIGALARRRPVVLYIDDVQWGDTDSVALLFEIIRPPRASPVLLLMTLRDEEARASPFLIEMNERWPAAADVREITVGGLATEDAQRLALAWIGETDEASRRTARAVAREAKGSPFLVEELVRSNRETATGEAGATLAVLTLAEVVGNRLAALPAATRCLAEVVAVSGRPLPLSTLATACADGAVTDEDVERLRSARIVRAGLRDGREVIEPCHDRIRETIVENLAPDVLRAHHGALVRALESASDADLEAVAIHALGSGDTERGARYVERAAEQAASKLAFDQAARLYHLALDTLPRPPDEARALRVRIAGALELAGQGARAAKVYLEAAAGAGPLEAIDLQRAASQQLLFSGHIEEGAALLRKVLAAVGMRAPRTPLGAIMSLLFHRLMLRLRGLQFRERSPEEVSLDNRLRVEALFTVALGFSVVDVILGACMQARFLRLALAVGHRMHVLQATSIQITHLASQGGRIRKAERAVYAIAERLSKSVGGPDAEAYFETCRGIALFHRGAWKDAHDALSSRIALRSDAFSHARLFGVYSLFYLGRLREHARRASRLLADSERRGDMYTAVNLHAAPLVDDSLTVDDPDAAREHLQKALAIWTQSGFHIQHWKLMVRGAEIELYVGDGPAACARLERDRRAYRNSLLGHSQFVREMTRYVRGCAAVAAALVAPSHTRRMRLVEARKAAGRLEREGMSWTGPLASLLLAATAHAEGDAATAMAALRVAIERAEAANMALHAAAARHQLGCLLGGDDGMEMRRQGETAMAAEGVRAPMRMAGVFVPLRLPAKAGRG